VTSPPPSQNKPAANALQNTPVIAVLRHGNLRKKKAAVLNNVPPSSQNRNFPRAYEVRSLSPVEGPVQKPTTTIPKQNLPSDTQNSGPCTRSAASSGLSKGREKKIKKIQKKRKIPLTLFRIGYIFILTATKGAVLKKMFDNQGKERRRI
jgi:hypothetical protein